MKHPFKVFFVGLLSCIFMQTVFALEWPSGDWSSRVAWEAKYAFGGRAYADNGTLPSSVWRTTSVGYDAWYGNFDYPYDTSSSANSWALQQSMSEAGGVVGELGNYDNIRYRSGWCTFFVRLVLFRSSFWTGNICT